MFAALWVAIASLCWGGSRHGTATIRWGGYGGGGAGVTICSEGLNQGFEVVVKTRCVGESLIHP